jgi:hypothetical protein
MFISKTSNSQIFASRPKRYGTPHGGSVTI